MSPSRLPLPRLAFPTCFAAEALFEVILGGGKGVLFTLLADCFLPWAWTVIHQVGPCERGMHGLGCRGEPKNKTQAQGRQQRKGTPSHQSCGAPQTSKGKFKNIAPQSLLPLWHLVQQMELFREWGYFPWGHKLSLFSLTPREGTSPVTPEGYIPTTSRSTWGKIRRRKHS